MKIPEMLIEWTGRFGSRVKSTTAFTNSHGEIAFADGTILEVRLSQTGNHWFQMTPACGEISSGHTQGLGRLVLACTGCEVNRIGRNAWDGLQSSGNPAADEVWANIAKTLQSGGDVSIVENDGSVTGWVVIQDDTLRESSVKPRT